MKKLIASLFLLASPLVFAGPGHHGHGHGYRHHHHWNHNHGWIAPAIIGGVVGYALTRPAPIVVQQQPEVIVVQQQPAVVQPTQCFITVRNPYTERDETVAVSCAK
jgi:hypothetical protein